MKTGPLTGMDGNPLPPGADIEMLLEDDLNNIMLKPDPDGGLSICQWWEGEDHYDTIYLPWGQVNAIIRAIQVYTEKYFKDVEGSDDVIELREQEPGCP